MTNTHKLKKHKNTHKTNNHKQTITNKQHHQDKLTQRVIKINTTTHTELTYNINPFITLRTTPTTNTTHIHTYYRFRLKSLHPDNDPSNPHRHHNLTLINDALQRALSYDPNTTQYFTQPQNTLIQPTGQDFT